MSWLPPAKKGGARATPWLHGELHEVESLDELLEVVFGLPEALPRLRKIPRLASYRRSCEALMVFLFTYIHQVEYFLKQAKKPHVTEAQIAAWDIPDEAANEILVASLLARLGAIPQGISHLRRSLELALSAAFLSSTYIQDGGDLWNPFGEAYVTNLWQTYHAEGRVLRASQVYKKVHETEGDVAMALRGFTEFYLREFADWYCDVHFEKERGGLVEAKIPASILQEIMATARSCRHSGCSERPTRVIVSHVPNLELTTAIVWAKLGDFGFDDALKASFDDLYALTSSYVHVTRQAHSHRPGWEKQAVGRWCEVVEKLLPCLSRTLVGLWVFHATCLPGLSDFLRDRGHDYYRDRFLEFREEAIVCGLFLGKQRTKDSG